MVLSPLAILRARPPGPQSVALGRVLSLSSSTIPPCCRQSQLLTVQRRFATTASSAESPEIRRVRFVSPFFTRRRFANLVFYATYSVLFFKFVLPRFFGVNISIGAEEHNDGHIPELSVPADEHDGAVNHNDSHVDDENLILFVPLSWPKSLPQEYYKGSDPEWQEFVKLAPDRARHRKMTKHVCDRTRARILAQPRLRRAMGSNVTVHRYMLDIVYPSGPPRDYDRNGLAFLSYGVGTAVQTITEEKFQRLATTLWPVDLINGLRHFWTTLYSIQLLHLKETLGIEIKKGSQQHAMQKALQVLAAQKSRKTSPSSGLAHNSASADTLAGLAAREATEDRLTTTPRPKPRTQSEPLQLPWYMPRAQSRKPSERQYNTWSMAMPIAIGSFFYHYHIRRHTQVKSKTPARGAYMVQGLVELKGSRGCATVYVRADCDPKTDDILDLNLVTTSVKQWKQKPVGGA